MSGNEKLKNNIQSAEAKWLDTSIRFVEKQFSTLFLPSHNVLHHLRTWDHAKNILNVLSDINCVIDYAAVEAVLLACMFHDTGMAITRKTEHGKESLNTYLEYLADQGTEHPSQQLEILRAIEYHDHKEEFIYRAFETGVPPDILTIVSIADDLDALGIIGIYRYSEIYLHRHTSLKSLGIKILENVSFRFNHLLKACYALPTFINEVKQPYKEVINFFDNYNQQFLMDTESETTFSGHIGIVNYIQQFCIQEKTNPEDLLHSISNYKVGNTVLNFFTDLDKALHEQNF